MNTQTMNTQTMNTPTMNAYLIKKTKGATRCRQFKCETYRNHPDWDKITPIHRQIPKNEWAMYVSIGYTKYCLCFAHAPAMILKVLAEAAELEDRAAELGWK